MVASDTSRIGQKRFSGSTFNVQCSGEALCAILIRARGLALLPAQRTQKARVVRQGQAANAKRWDPWSVVTPRWGWYLLLYDLARRSFLALPQAGLYQALRPEERLRSRLGILPFPMRGQFQLPPFAALPRWVCGPGRFPQDHLYCLHVYKAARGRARTPKWAPLCLRRLSAHQPPRPRNEHAASWRANVAMLTEEFRAQRMIGVAEVATGAVIRT